MSYTKDEVIQFCYEEDVKFIRLAFCDVWGKQKNISIMAKELSAMALRLTALQLQASAARFIRIYCFIPIRIRWLFFPGDPSRARLQECFVQ